MTVPMARTANRNGSASRTDVAPFFTVVKCIGKPGGPYEHAWQVTAQ